MNRQVLRRVSAPVERVAHMVSAISGSDFSMNRMLAALAGARPQPAPPLTSRPSTRPGEVEAVGKSELSEYEWAKVGKLAGGQAASSVVLNAVSSTQSRGLVEQSAVDARFAQPSNLPAGQFIDVRA